MQICATTLGSAARVVYSTPVFPKPTFSQFVALAVAILVARPAAGQDWGAPIEPRAPEPVVEPAPTNPDWSDAPPTQFESRSPTNPDWVLEDEPPQIGSRRLNAAGAYDIRYANRSLTMPLGMMRGTFDVVGGRLDSETTSTMNLGAAVAVGRSIEIGFSRYRMGSFPSMSLLPNEGFGAEGLVSMLFTPEVAFGDIPFYVRFQPLKGRRAQLAFDAVFRIPTRTEFGFLFGAPMRFVAAERVAFDTGVEVAIDNNPQGQSVWSMALPFGVTANVTKQFFLKVHSGMNFFDLSHVVRTETSGLVNGPFYFIPLAFGGGYTFRAKSTMIDAFVLFRFPTLYGFTTEDSDVNSENWAITVGLNVYSPLLFGRTQR